MHVRVTFGNIMRYVTSRMAMLIPRRRDGGGFTSALGRLIANAAEARKHMHAAFAVRLKGTEVISMLVQ